MTSNKFNLDAALLDIAKADKAAVNAATKAAANSKFSQLVAAIPAEFVGDAIMTAWSAGASSENAEDRRAGATLAKHIADAWLRQNPPSEIGRPVKKALNVLKGIPGMPTGLMAKAAATVNDASGERSALEFVARYEREVSNIHAVADLARLLKRLNQSGDATQKAFRDWAAGRAEEGAIKLLANIPAVALLADQWLTDHKKAIEEDRRALRVVLAAS